jgi:hypothetical protein
MSETPVGLKGPAREAIEAQRGRARKMKLSLQMKKIHAKYR